MKSRIYESNPQDLDELEQNIRTAIASIEEETLKRVFLNFQRRLVMCTENDGGHFKRQL